jgi:hypothetical protein
VFTLVMAERHDAMRTVAGAVVDRGGYVYAI